MAIILARPIVEFLLFFHFTVTITHTTCPFGREKKRKTEEKKQKSKQGVFLKSPEGYLTQYISVNEENIQTDEAAPPSCSLRNVRMV